MANYREPVGYTCPDIDNVLSQMREVEACLSLIEDKINDIFNRTEDEYIENLIVRIREEIRIASGCVFISGEMEDLRSSNDALRIGGHELVDEIGVLENEIDRLKREVDRLDVENDGLKNDIYNLEIKMED